jgi:hypothetical protein
MLKSEYQLSDNTALMKGKTAPYLVILKALLVNIWKNKFVVRLPKNPKTGTLLANNWISYKDNEEDSN